MRGLVRAGVPGRRSAGFTLIEVMVAVAMALLLMLQVRSGLLMMLIL